MTTREKAQKLLDELPESELEPIVEILASRGKGKTDKGKIASSAQAKEPKKRRRLSFSGIGAGDPPDASERVDEFVGLAIDRRHPRS